MMLKNYTKLFDEIGTQIELITGDEMIKYSKNIMKIKFKTNDDLLLSKMINIPVFVLIVDVIFKEIDEYYPQVLL